MFKKLKDKLAEEVKSSPQRIQQFAQAAQAAVTSASSSISDITNNDLFSIGDNDGQQNRPARVLTSPGNQNNTFQDVSLGQAQALPTSSESVDYASSQDTMENQRQRRLSNSSFSSDVSFRLPSYESPSMYHLQSDMEVSASEADERGLSGGAVSLDRITKEQIYAAYRRTQERYTKYRTQYADLARHYKLLERENAKAKSVLVETQDKALRRISELREQCTLEQSAKAHLEKALRVDIEERNMKIDSLNKKIQLLQNDFEGKSIVNSEIASKTDTVSEAQLINLSTDNENKPLNDESLTPDITSLNNKIEKLEQLLSKYKESLKASKEKNSQLSTDLQIMSAELESNKQKNDQLHTTNEYLTEARQEIQKLSDINEELQNSINTQDFTKRKEISTLEMDLQKAHEEITQLHSKIEVFNKREEEYAISLAENKLRIHKELESKEAEIKSLKDNLTDGQKEIKSLNILINDCKNKNAFLEDERSKHTSDSNELHMSRSKIVELETKIQDLIKKCQSLENHKVKANEEYKCLQLQLKQETAEKLAMIDRNVYLENRNSQLSEENVRKSTQISNMDDELQSLKKNKDHVADETGSDKLKMLEEVSIWKNKCNNLESEIQEERVELVKLQSEIETLLTNYELIQTQNTELQMTLSSLKSENTALNEKMFKASKIKNRCEGLLEKVKNLQNIVSLTSKETKIVIEANIGEMYIFKDKINSLINTISDVNKTDSHKAMLKELEREYAESKVVSKNVSEQLETSLSELKSLQKEYMDLKYKVESNQSEKAVIAEQLQNSQDLYESLSIEAKTLQSEKQSLQEKVDDLERRCLKLKTEQEDNTNNYTILQGELEKTTDKFEKTTNELSSLQKLHMELQMEVKAVQSEKAFVEEQLQNMKILYETILENEKSLRSENQNLQEKLEDSESRYHQFQVGRNENDNECATLQTELNKLTEQFTKTSSELRSLQTEQLDLKLEVKANESEKSIIEEKLRTVDSQYEKLLHELKSIQTENQGLVEKINHSESENQQFQVEIEKGTNENATLKTKLNKVFEKFKKTSEELDLLKNEHTNLKLIVDSYETEKLLLEQKLHDIKSQYEDVLEEFKYVQKEKQLVEEQLIVAENRSRQFEFVIEEENNQRLVLSDKAKTIEQDNQELIEKVKRFEEKK